MKSNFWPRLPIDQTATVFVPLCGKTLDMRWLRERGLSRVEEDVYLLQPKP